MLEITHPDTVMPNLRQQQEDSLRGVSKPHPEKLSLRKLFTQIFTKPNLSETHPRRQRLTTSRSIKSRVLREVRN